MMLLTACDGELMMVLVYYKLIQTIQINTNYTDTEIDKTDYIYIFQEITITVENSKFHICRQWDWESNSLEISNTNWKTVNFTFPDSG